MSRIEVRDIFRRAAVGVVRDALMVGGVVAGAAALAGRTVAGMPLGCWAIGVTIALITITVAAMMPGMMLPSGGVSSTRASLLMVGGTAAMAVRSVGAVALVVGCRYKIAAAAPQGLSENDSGGLVYLMIGLGYAATTFDEVWRLAAAGRKLDVTTG